MTQQNDSDSLGMGFATRHMWRALQRHRGLFAIWFLAVSIVGIGILFILEPSYTATAMVAVTPQAADPLAQNDQQSADQFEDNDLTSTIASMMQSREVAAAVLATIPPAQAHEKPRLLQAFCDATFVICRGNPPADPARAKQYEIDQFLKELSVSPQDHSRIIDVSVTAASATRAQALADAVVQNFQRIALEQQTEQLDSTSKWLNTRTEQLRQQWFAAVDKANEYSLANGLVEVSDGTAAVPIADKRLSDVSADLTNAQSELAAAHEKSGQTAGNADGLHTLSQQPIVVATASALMQLESQRENLAGEFGPKFPKIVSLDRQIASMRSLMRQESGEQRSSTQERASAAEAEVRELTTELNKMRTQAAAESVEEAEYSSLQAEAASARTTYNNFLEHAEDVSGRDKLLEPPVKTVSDAGLPLRPTFPNIPKLSLGILVLAIVSGMSAVMVKEHFSEGFEGMDELCSIADVPLLANFPLLRATDGRSIVNHVLEQPFSRTSESVRGLAASLSLLAANRNGPRAVLITSAGTLEGKSTIAAWLAMTARQSGQGVLLIDGDYHRGMLLRGMLAQQPGEDSTPGLTDLLAGGIKPQEVIQHDPDTKIDFIASGAQFPRPFGSEEIARLRKIISDLKRSYSMIVIDSPPLMAMADGFVLASVADQTLLVCRWQYTSRSAIAASVSQMQSYGANVVGVVASMVEQKAELALGGQYGRVQAALISRRYGI